MAVATPAADGPDPGRRHGLRRRGQILNKPLDRADAERMIRLQEGHDTDVITGLCLYRADREEWIGAVEVSVVRFRPLSDAERDAYLDSAGGKASRAATASRTATRSSRSSAGSFSNVVGLPMERLARLLRDAIRSR